MRNQFIYTEKVPVPLDPESEEYSAENKFTTVERKHSFNMKYVIRSLEMDGGGLLLLLDDLHERWQDVPSMTKNGKKMIKREKDTFQSEIRLSKEDGERYLKLSEILE